MTLSILRQMKNDLLLTQNSTLGKMYKRTKLRPSHKALMLWQKGAKSIQQRAMPHQRNFERKLICFGSLK